MNVQDVEKALGITRANIRFYEREGLLSPDRKENGYRDYTNDDIVRLKKIIIFRKLGLSVADIKEILNGSLQLRDAIKNNIENLEKSMTDLSGAMDVCDEIVSKNIDEKDFSEEYFWDLINRKEKEGENFENVYKDYIKKFSKSSLILLTIICISPLLNILFDYFCLKETPESQSIVIAILCLCLPVTVRVGMYKAAQYLSR